MGRATCFRAFVCIRHRDRSGYPYTTAAVGNLDQPMGIAYDPYRDLLYASTTHAGLLGKVVIEVNRLTGQRIASHSVGLAGFTSAAEGDVAFDPLTGNVFALRSGGSIHIWNSLSKTVVGSFTLPESNDYSCLAFDPSGNLWLIDPNSRVADAPQLFRINKSTGAILETRTLSVKIGVVAGLAFHPVTGEAFLADACIGDDLCLGNRLFTIDVATGTLTLVGEMGHRICGLAFVPNGSQTPVGSFTVHDGADGSAPVIPADFSIPINFGTVPRAVATTRPITVKNSGSVNIEVLTALADSGFGTAGVPASPALLEPGQTLTFNSVVQTGLSTLGGTYSGKLSIYGRAQGAASYLPYAATVTASVPISIEYNVSGPYGALIDNQPDPVFFQRNPGGNGSVFAAFIVTSTGSDPLIVNSATLPPGFSTTTTFPRTINSGQTMSINVTSTGPTPGLYQGNLVIQTNHDGRPNFTVPLSAVHNLPRMNVTSVGISGSLSSGVSLSFGETARGGVVGKSLNIRNTLSPALVISSVDLPTGYALQFPPTFPVILGLNQTLSLSVTLTALIPGPNQGTLKIHSNDFDFPQFDIELSGAVDASSVFFYGFSSYTD